MTDAVREAYELVRIGCALGHTAPPLPPKNGARFHFELPGSVQGFKIDKTAAGSGRLANVAGESRLGRRSLSIQFDCTMPNTAVRIGTPTFMTPVEAKETHYALMASPTLFPGQTVHARLEADAANAAAVTCRLYVSVYGQGDSVKVHRGGAIAFPPGGTDELLWKIGDLGGAPIASVGIEITPEKSGSGTVFLDYLDWTGVPETTFRRVGEAGESAGMWLRAWVNAVDSAAMQCPNAFHLSQSKGTGLFIMGGGDWRDYVVKSTITPRLGRSFGLAARVRGLRRYYAFVLAGNQSARILRRSGEEVLLSETHFRWEFEQPYEVKLDVSGMEIAGSVDGKEILTVKDTLPGVDSGGFGYVCEEGLVLSDELTVRPKRI